MFLHLWASVLCLPCFQILNIILLESIFLHILNYNCLYSETCLLALQESDAAITRVPLFLQSLQAVVRYQWDVSSISSSLNKPNTTCNWYKKLSKKKKKNYVWLESNHTAMIYLKNRRNNSFLDVLINCKSIQHSLSYHPSERNRSLWRKGFYSLYRSHFLKKQWFHLFKEELSSTW